MPQDSLRSVVYRSFVTCDDPKGVADAKTMRKSKRAMPKSRSPSKSELQKLSDSQVMEVSRGAEKLTQAAIGSLSDRPSFDTTSDLLRGALDLQESLAMLGKFQEASKLIANSAAMKKKKKEKEREEREERDFHGFEKQRVSAARDCYDELRDVIKESFARQNLLPRVHVVDVDVDVDRRRNSQLCADLPSSSGSSSLNYARSSSSSPLGVRARGGERMKGSNLIAKLMGLEEVPSKAGAIFTKTEKEKEMVRFQRGLFLDIDLPRAKKPEFMVKKVVRERRRTLEEIIETMQFKGILERKQSVDRYNDCKLYNNPYFSRKDLAAEEGPPIVIMKPLRGEEPRLCRGWIDGHEQHLKSRLMPSKTREEFRPRARLKEKETNEKSAAKQKVDRGKEEKNVGSVRVREVKKAVDSQDRVSTKKMNQSKPLLPPVPKKEVVQKVEKIAKVGTNTRKVGETKDDKPQTLKQSRTGRENVSKSPIARGKVPAADKSTKPTPLSSTSPKKNPRRGESKSKASSASSVENRASDGNSAINSEKTLVKSTEQEQTSEEACCIFDDSRDAASSFSDDSGPITKDSSDHVEDDSCIPGLGSDQIKGCRDILDTRYLLLSSVSFLNHVEEFFDTGTHDSTFFHINRLHDGELLHDSLLLDCAKEILQHKSLCCRSMRNQWSESLSRRPKYHLSTEKLVEEICSSIEDLHSYSKSCGDLVLEDSIHPMLERDLWWNEDVTGSWGSGWRKGYAMEAVDGVMLDLEELVLSEVVAEMMMETM